MTMMYSYPSPTAIDVFYTNSEGYLITPEVLPYGEYSLVEVQAPYGYVLDKTPVSFRFPQKMQRKKTRLLSSKLKSKTPPRKVRSAFIKREIFSQAWQRLPPHTQMKTVK